MGEQLDLFGYRADLPFEIFEFTPSFPLKNFYNLFSKSRFNPPYYDRLLARHVFSDFLKTLLTNKKRSCLLKLAKKKLHDEIIIDLGCGVSSMNALEVCSILGVDTYIGVDFQEMNRELSYLDMFESKGRLRRGTKKIKAIKVQGDFFNFVGRLRDGSVSYMLNGIDNFVVNGGQRWLTKQIHRTTKEKGVVIGENNCVAHLLELEYGWNAPFTKDENREEFGFFDKRKEINEGYNYTTLLVEKV